MKKNKSRLYQKFNSIWDQMQYLFEELATPITVTISEILTGEKNMWIAKNRVTGETYGNKFNSIMDCEDYIEKELKYLNKFLRMVEEEKNEIFKTGYNGARIIQCYNLSQKRWADGFDY